MKRFIVKCGMFSLVLLNSCGQYQNLPLNIEQPVVHNTSTVNRLNSSEKVKINPSKYRHIELNTIDSQDVSQNFLIQDVSQNFLIQDFVNGKLYSERKLNVNFSSYSYDYGTTYSIAGISYSSIINGKSDKKDFNLKDKEYNKKAYNTIKLISETMKGDQSENEKDSFESLLNSFKAGEDRNKIVNPTLYFKGDFSLK